MLEIKNLSFRYPSSQNHALKDINLNIKEGEFVLITGPSGAAKSTLLKLIKPQFKMGGEINGKIEYLGQNIYEISKEKSATEIGYVSQNENEQIITDRVSSELAFGLESMGMCVNNMRGMAAEISEYFNIKEIYNRKTNELSGGQKQIVNLASTFILKPKLILLDEPFSRLDPKECENFINILISANQTLNTTIILVEQKTQDILPKVDRMIYMEKGKVVYDDRTINTISNLLKSDRYRAMYAPSSSKIGYCLKADDTLITIKQTRQHLKTQKNIPFKNEKQDRIENKTKTIVEMKDCCYKFSKTCQDVVSDCNINIQSGKITAILGSNGGGKTTILRLLMGVIKPYRGKVKLLDSAEISLLPQDVKSIIIEQSVFKELESMQKDKEKIIKELQDIGLIDLKDRHPYDISEGQRQRLAISKMLFNDTDVILMDEPTKGLDPYWREKLAERLINLKKQGKTIVIVSHDLEFCANYADRCGLIFNKQIVSTDDAKSFFINNYFYTTAVRKITRDIIEGIITEKEALKWCKKAIEKTDI